MGPSLSSSCGLSAVLARYNKKELLETIYSIDTMAAIELTTTLQVDEKTRELLLRYAAEIQAKLGRRVSFDETIRTLIEDATGEKEARSRFDQMSGLLRGEKGIWRELGEVRRDERRRLERKARLA